MSCTRSAVPRFLDQAMQLSITDSIFKTILTAPSHKGYPTHQESNLFFLYTVQGSHNDFALNFTFSIAPQPGSDDVQRRIRSNVTSFVTDGKYFDQSTLTEGQNLLDALVDDDWMQEQNYFNEATYLKINRKLNNGDFVDRFQCEIWEEKYYQNEMQVKYVHSTGYKSTADKDAMVAAMINEPARYWSIPDALTATDLCEPHHILRMLGGCLKHDLADLKGITFQYNYSHLHSFLKNNVVGKQYSSHTRVTYGFLSYYSLQENTEVGILYMAKFTPFKYELKRGRTLEERVREMEAETLENVVN
jgi:hypothetical protein